MGYGWAGQLAVGPLFNPANDLTAVSLYGQARDIDRAAGRVWADGASVLAGAKAAQRRGLISGYRWAFTVADVINTLCDRGPVVLGLPWYEGMYETEANGRVRVNGPMVGGHCILATGYVHDHPDWGGHWIEWLNSWGPRYGVNGRGWIDVKSFERLLLQDGEACIANEVNPALVKVSVWERLKGLWNRG